MKKLFSLVLALALLLSLSVPAFAAEITTNGGTSADVNGTYVAGAESAIVYSVDIEWSSMNFTYTDSSKGTWNIGSHIYENGTEASWTGTGTITIINHSNDGIVVTPIYTQEEAYKDASMTFSTDALTIASADNGEGTDGAGVAKSGIITVIPTGSLPEDTKDTKIGIITLTITGENSSAGESDATVVTTAEELTTAMAAGGNIKLGADIDLGTSGLTVVNGTNVALDLTDYTLSNSSNAMILVLGDLTVKGGTINAVNVALLVPTGGNLTVNGTAVSGSTSIANSGGTITVNNGTFQSTGTAPTIENSRGTLTINGGTVTGNIGVTTRSGTTMYINGGDISGTTHGINNEGNTTITGGSITGDIAIRHRGDLTVGGSVVITGTSYDFQITSEQQTIDFSSAPESSYSLYLRAQTVRSNFTLPASWTFYDSTGTTEITSDPIATNTKCIVKAAE